MDWLSDIALQRLRAAAGAPDLSATKYRLLQKFSAGGMGTIYLAEDARLLRKVALKVMHLADPAGEQTARMMREARVIAQLEHPGIVPVHDVGELPDGRVFYVMKFVQGQRLDQYATDQRALPERLRVFQKICEAVAFAHANGVIHRDLKPENVMVGAFGEVLVMDWGLAKIMPADVLPDKSRIEDRGSNVESASIANQRNQHQTTGIEHRASSIQHQTQHGTIMGTPAYMAPEQRRGEIGEIDPRTDVYALGAILKFLLPGEAGTHIVDITRNGKPANHSSSPFPSKAPKYLTAICAKAMAVTKTQRYAGALELANDVERFLNGLAVTSYRENILERAWRLFKQYRFMVLLVLAYLLVRFALFFLFRP
ncbi:MAG: serine/threonine-protein kinase [bacterium]